jgi:chaperonin GroEL
MHARLEKINARGIKLKVEDAVHSTQNAFRSGVVRGAGLALASVKTSSPILNAALQQPCRQLALNMGIDDMGEFKPDEALNVVTGERGDYVKVGVMDPAEALIAATESAVSVAGVLLTSAAMIVETPKKE